MAGSRVANFRTLNKAVCYTNEARDTLSTRYNDLESVQKLADRHK